MADNFDLFDTPQVPAKAKPEEAPEDFSLFDTPQHTAPPARAGGRPNFDPAQDADEPVELQPTAAPSSLSRGAAAVAQPFKDIGNGMLAANRFATHAIFHPVDTAQAIKANPLANAREAMRGVNDNIPFANRAVEAIGGPAAESPEDAEAALPDTRAFGAVAGAPAAGEMIGGLAAKALETAAPAVASVVKKIGKGAEERQIARTKEALELKVNKGTRAKLKADSVDKLITESPALRAAAGDDAKVAEVTGGVKGRAAAQLKPIYEAAGPADEAVAKAVSNVDERIAELKKGDVNDAAAAKKLQQLRDEFNNRLGERPETSASDLRAEQSAYQKNGYAKNYAADPEVATTILAHREMSKAIGDGLIEHVTGMPYEAAKAAAASDPTSVAARLFKANDQISAANKIEAGIADRASRVKPEHGPMAVAKRVAHHAVAPMFVGASHGLGAGLATAAGQELLHAAPGALRAAASGTDRLLAATARRAAPVIGDIGGPALTPTQRIKAAIAAGEQRRAALAALSLTPAAPGAPIGGVPEAAR